jgi:hypothetical protein
MRMMADLNSLAIDKTLGSLETIWLRARRALVLMKIGGESRAAKIMFRIG